MGYEAIRPTFAMSSLMLLTLAACAGGVSSAPVPPQAVRTLLGTGASAALPVSASGAVCENIRTITQDAQATLTHSHPAAGFVYGVTGTATLTVVSSASQSVGPAQSSSYIPPNVSHTHANLTNAPIVWDFVAVRPAGTCAAPDAPGNVLVFRGPDAIVSAGNYKAALENVDMPPSAQTVLHSSTLTLILVTRGTVNVLRSGQSPQELTSGNGVFETPDTVGIETNDSGSQAQFLQFTLAPS